MLDAVDAIVTYQGTVGIEFASLGKPVLLSDRGWYSEFGFALCPGSRDAYLPALRSEWWQDVPPDAQRLARIFAGWYFGRPSWQKRFVLEDDHNQWTLYPAMPRFLEDAADE